MKSWLSVWCLLCLTIGFSEALAKNEQHAAKDTDVNGLNVFANHIVVEDIVTSLAFPKAMKTVIDRTNSTTHVLIVTRDGALIIVNDKNEKLTFDLPLNDLYTDGQGGVLDMLIPSQFPETSTVLLSYSKGNDSANRLAVVKAQLSLTSGVSHIEPVIEVAQAKDTPVHYGGKLLQLDGNRSLEASSFLVTTGDGFDYREQAQIINSQLGKVLGFTINGNPLVNPPFPESPFVFSLGHRNPQGLAYGPGGQLFLHEHGPDGGDEVNLLQRGSNYGWPVVTLGKDYSGARISPFSTYPGMVAPLVDWTPSIAPSSMLYYTNSQHPALTEGLLVTSLKSKALFAVHQSASGYTSNMVFNKLEERLRDVAADHNGNILLLTDGENARVVKLSPE